MTNGDREIRLQIMLEPNELEAIEDWRFTKRMPSRAAAVRELLRRGLAAEGFEFAELGKPSKAYSVTEDSPPVGNGLGGVKQR